MVKACDQMDQNQLSTRYLVSLLGFQSKKEENDEKREIGMSHDEGICIQKDMAK
jgi:hypothetical protein